jgi:hypothetical protein
MALFTHEDDLRFRRTTWLLSKLQAIGPRSEDPSLPDADAALQQLSSLANLFVRQHEVVAVIPAKPTAAPSQQDLYVTAQMEDEDEGHLENVIGGSVVDVKELDTVPSRDEVIASSITNFQQHVQTVFSFLKQAAQYRCVVSIQRLAGGFAVLHYGNMFPENIDPGWLPLCRLGQQGSGRGPGSEVGR